VALLKNVGSRIGLAALLLPLHAFGAGAESPQIAALRDGNIEARDAAVGSFWERIEKSGTPLVEPIDGGAKVRVTFVWREPIASETPNVGLIGSFVPGGSRTLAHFERVPGTDVLHVSFEVSAAARYRYYLAWPEGRHPEKATISRLTLNGLSYELFTDPRAAHSYDDFDGKPIPTSYFEGPAAPEEPWLVPRSAVKQGDVETIDVASRTLGNTRKVSVYTPAAYRDAAKSYPLLLMFDGEAYLQAVPTATMLDNLIADHVLPPLVAAFVSPIDETHRSHELQPNTQFAKFIVDELLPAIRKRWDVTRDPRRAVIAGSSLGGLAAANIARLYPRAFGNVLSMSGSYWWHPTESDNEDDAAFESGSGWLPRLYASTERLPLRFYVCVGLGEGNGMLAPNRLFRDVLTTRGYSLRYEEFQGDHSYLNWRDSLVAGLRHLLGET
jgi:enterochelin esterase family protein